MKNYLLGITVVALLSACGNSTDESSHAVVKNLKNLYALKPTVYKWPPGSSDTHVAGNVLAKNYYLVLDGSGSMNETKCSDGNSKLRVAKNAITSFIKQIPSGANVGLTVFDGNGVAEREPLGQDRNNVIQAVNDVYAGGSTPLATAIKLAYRVLTNQAQKQLGYGEYHLVVITDDVADPGEDPGTVVGDILSNSPIIVHTIGFCIGTGHSLNIPGKVDYRSANNPEELEKGLESVLAESSSYTDDSFQKDSKAP